MATIEKEKALDVVRQMVADGQVSQEVAEKYFPELKESDDEKMMKSIIENLKGNMYRTDGDYDLLNKQIAWLKKQGEPTNWSEEDEKCLRLSTDIIDSALRAGFCVQLDRDRCVDWIKSIRHQLQWKPSEEQMETLEYYMHTLFATNHKEVLFGLYNDLKQL